MYDELVKSLRICGDSSDPIAECCYEDCTEHECPINPLCMQSLCYKAADAIEFLQTYKVAFENIISMGGWWLVGQDKNLYRMDVPMNWPPKGTKTVELFTLPQPPKEE